MKRPSNDSTKLSQTADSAVPITFPTANPHIERRKDKRGYETPCGRLPSVTTIIKETAPQESKDRLEAWLARPGARQESAAACRRGSWVHQQIENHLGGLPVENHLAFGGYYRNIIGWIEQNVVEPIAMEKPIFHPAGFSGTFDCLAYCSEWMEPTLIDWKTSKRKRSADLVDGYMDQLGAYSLGIKHTYDIEPTKAVLAIARPTGTEPDIWVVDHDEILYREEKFLQRVDDYNRFLARFEQAA